jgi:hypothetical protein
MTETEFSSKICSYLIATLKLKGWGHIKVGERKNILSSITVGRLKSQWEMIFGFLEQDIIFYLETLDINDLKSEYISIPRATKDKKFIIPLAILELKIGKNINTHQFITYGQIAKEIKTIFPHCAYYFVSSGGQRMFSPETLLRHTKEFDRVFMEWEKDKEIVIQDLILHFKYLKRLGVI